MIFFKNFYVFGKFPPSVRTTVSYAFIMPENARRATAATAVIFKYIYVYARARVTGGRAHKPNAARFGRRYRIKGRLSSLNFQFVYDFFYIPERSFKLGFVAVVRGIDLDYNGTVEASVRKP